MDQSSDMVEAICIMLHTLMQLRFLGDVSVHRVFALDSANHRDSPYVALPTEGRHRIGMLAKAVFNDSIKEHLGIAAFSGRPAVSANPIIHNTSVLKPPSRKVQLEARFSLLARCVKCISLHNS